MRIFVAQHNPIIGDLEGNTQKILHYIDQAKSKNRDIVVFPELAISGYPPEDLLLQDSFVTQIESCLDQIIAASEGILILVGLPRRNPSRGEKPLYNSVALIRDKALLGFQDKWLLPTYDVFDERRYFEPGQATGIWEHKGKRIGVVICEDMWQHAGYVGNTRYFRDPILALLEHKPDILINCSASPYEFHKKDLRVKVCGKAAKTLNCPMIYCCQVGGNDELVFDGYSMYVSPQGNLLQLAKGFVEDTMLIDTSAETCALTFSYDPWHDLYYALVLGVRDYFVKSNFTKACLGLSGGIDSALVACIVTEALGSENVLGITMPSRFTSPQSIKDAEDLANNLNIKLLNIPIEEPFSSFLSLLDPYFKDKPSDVTEENMQSRIRGMILMALSNKLGYIVTSTGNKSESALGYCTLYGDMVGGLGVISDVIKSHVYELSRWINKRKPLIPISTLEKAPSAELRSDQKDTDSLPEYDVVDTVLTAYVEDYLSPEEISLKYELPLDLINDLIRRIHRAEYKRRQGPPGIRVSKKSFQVGRYYPIVQGWR